MGGKARYADPEDAAQPQSSGESLKFDKLRAELLKNPKRGYGGVSAADRVADYDRQIARAKKNKLSKDHWRVKYLHNRMAQDEAKLDLHNERDMAKKRGKGKSDPYLRGARSNYDFLQQDARVGGSKKGVKRAGAESAPKTRKPDNNLHYSKTTMQRSKPAGSSGTTTTVSRTSTPRRGLNLAQLASVARGGSSARERNAKMEYLLKTSRTRKD